jgi:uncharacterized protein (TIGR03118 family)
VNGKLSTWKVCILLSALALCFSSTAVYPHNGDSFIRQNLVSDIPGVALHTDANLVDPTAVATGFDGSLFVVNAGSSDLTVYATSGRRSRTGGTPKLFTLPLRPDGSRARPAAVLMNDFDDVTLGGSRADILIFGEDGTISGVSTDSGSEAVVMADRSQDGASFTGAAITQDLDSKSRIFAANFADRRVDVFDAELGQLSSLVDLNVGQGFAPFGIAVFADEIFVSYVQVADNGSIVRGEGKGMISVFDRNTLQFLRRFAEGGFLNAPKAIVLAPENFGVFAGDILVANFGDGRILAFDPTTGEFKGFLLNRRGEPITIDGLSGLAFSDSRFTVKPSLFFTAAIDEGRHGLFGRIRLDAQEKSE